MCLRGGSLGCWGSRRASATGADVWSPSPNPRSSEDRGLGNGSRNGLCGERFVERVFGETVSDDGWDEQDRVWGRLLFTKMMKWLFTG